MIAGFTALHIASDLPSTDEILKTELKIPLRVFSSNGQLIAEYGDERRKPTELDELPASLINAILASEDDNFFDHVGIDFSGIIRAMLTNYRSGTSQQGASTITMQVARNYFLSSEKTYVRKLREIMLSFKLESTISKEDILKLYVNKIFLGHRAYGFGAAAEVYYGKTPAELSLSEQATLAGLPKAPSRDNPITNPKRAENRRNYVLSRLNTKGWLDDEQHQAAKAEPVSASKHNRNIEVSAPYVAEMVRASLIETYGEQVYWQGWEVHTTIDANAQNAANKALRKGLLAYDRRHGFRGPIENIAIDNQELTLKTLQKIPYSGDIIPAAVLQTSQKSATLLNRDGQTLSLALKNASWAKKQISTAQVGREPKNLSKLLKVGDVVYIKQTGKTAEQNDEPIWELSQLPQVQGAVVSLEPKTGQVIALTGGFDYYFNKYNRATQAKRQPGSGIKPFVYAAALERGYSPSTLISGAPVVVEEPAQGTVWRPQNYSGKFYGPTTIRSALARSLNTVSVRLLRSIGLEYTRNYIHQFGLDQNRLPKSLSLALGAGHVTPLEVATAYAALANTGYKTHPYFIKSITSRQGETLYTHPKNQLCDTCDAENSSTKISPRIMSAEDNFLIVNMMQDVVKYGTAKKANVLERNDLAGKTGTTNDYVDAWFSGFTPSIATTVWVGFDRPQTMGRAESGGRAALPIWIDFMQTALQSRPEKSYAIPSGIARNLDPVTEKTEYYSTIKPKSRFIDPESDNTSELRLPRTIDPQTPSETGTQTGLF